MDKYYCKKLKEYIEVGDEFLLDWGVNFVPNDKYECVITEFRETEIVGDYKNIADNKLFKAHRIRFKSFEELVVKKLDKKKTKKSGNNMRKVWW